MARAPNEGHWVAVDSRDRGVGLSGCSKAGKGGKGQGDRSGGGDENGGVVGFRQGCMRVRSK